MSKSIFITATGTDVGKTYVSALLVKKLHNANLNVGYYKPALSGLEAPVLSDVAYVKKTASIPQSSESMVSYTYQKAVSPHLAAKLEGCPPELATIKQAFDVLSSQYAYLTVEGCGGIVCPLRYDSEQKIFLEDIINTLQLATIVVTDAALGSINSTVLTVEYLKQKNITIKGIIVNNYDANDSMQQDNVKMFAELTRLPILALVPPNAQTIDISIQQLMEIYQ